MKFPFILFFRLDKYKEIDDFFTKNAAALQCSVYITNKFEKVKKQIAKTGKVVYLYFRLGEDPGTESQKIQGYLAQMPELKHFRFKVRGEQSPAPAPAPQAPM